MKKLKLVTKTIYEVDYNDLDNFINETYEKSYGTFEVVADQESRNDSAITLRVKKEPLSKWEIANLQKFKETGRGSFVLHTLMKDLANQDLIPEGDYVIEICW